MARKVIIECFPESAPRYRAEHAIVVIDVIRATTTAITAAAMGRRVFPVPSIEAAVPLAARLDRPLLVGELGGNMPYGFDLTNSPAAIAEHSDVDRPMILLSTSGTKLLDAAAGATGVYPACLRNITALADHLASEHDNVAVIGAGTRGEFREEDQLCCSWIAARLLDAGFEPARIDTERLVERWRDAPVEDLSVSNSVKYLRDTGQLHDLEFILEHVDDVDQVYTYDGTEIVQARA